MDCIRGNLTNGNLEEARRSPLSALLPAGRDVGTCCLHGTLSDGGLKIRRGAASR
jgi:hypothetical protein